MRALRPGSGPDGTTELPATRTLSALGTQVSVSVTEQGRVGDAVALLEEDLSVLDRTCSRFRPDSELSMVEHTGSGRPVRVSPLLFDLLEVSCAVAVATAGTVDPTVGKAMVELGYDRDFAEVTLGARSAEGAARPAPGWWTIRLDPETRTVSIPEGVHVDVGATAKAYAADRGARRIADALGGGVLVNLGGDLSAAGEPPPGGWSVGIAPSCTVPTSEVDQVVAISGGGLATSGTTARAWRCNGRRVHHIVDPATGVPADPVWSLVSTTAPTCVEANGWSTAAVVWGEDAISNLVAEGVPARLVRRGGGIVVLGGWPTEAGGPSRGGSDVGDGVDALGTARVS